MRLLLINPNMTEGVTDRLLAAARAIANPGTQIVPLTAPRGFPYISCRSEAQIAGTVVLEMLADHREGVDGAIIGAFGDPGLPAARELFPFPVVGISEAAMLTACMLGARFAIITFTRALAPWYEEGIAANGFASRCAGIRTLDGVFTSLANVQDEKEALLVDLANRAVVENFADVIILAGAPLAGLAARVRDKIPVPVVDQVAAAVTLLEALVRLGLKKPATGTYAPPAPKPNAGLPEKLAALMAGKLARD